MDKFERSAIGIGIISALIYLGLAAVVIWAIITLVIHFTG